MHNDCSVRPSADVRVPLKGRIFAEVENWRRAQDKIPSRSKAIRLLLERALAARPDGPRRPSRVTTASVQKLERLRATSTT